MNEGVKRRDGVGADGACPEGAAEAGKKTAVGLGVRRRRTL